MEILNYYLVNIKPVNTQLETYLNDLLGPEKDSFCNTPAESAAIRVNNLKIDTKEFLKYLSSLNYQYKDVDYNPSGFILEKDPLPLSHTLAFFEGFFQYQGISSQIPVIILNPRPGQKVLDITAAPGSKSTQIASMMDQRGILVVNDSSRSRLQGLQTNLQRCGAMNVYILNQRGEKLSRLYSNYFDKILVDAPCSALGTLSFNRQLQYWWSEDKLKKLSELQYRILLSAFKSLKAGGELVYSTCSVAPEENEIVIDKMLQKFPLKIIEIDNNLQMRFERGYSAYQGQNLNPDLEKALRIWPHKHGQEGFFVVKMQKTDDWPVKESMGHESWKATYSIRNGAIKNILESIGEKWGIEESIWPDFRYIRSKDRIWIVRPEIDCIPVEHFISGGILLAERRNSGWKLTNSSAQILSGIISKRKINLQISQLQELFKSGRVSYSGIAGGYYALQFDERVIASVYFEKDNLRIRLPHSFNLIL